MKTKRNIRTVVTLTMMALLWLQLLSPLAPRASAQTPARVIMIRKVARGEEESARNLPVLKSTELKKLIDDPNVKVVTDASIESSIKAAMQVRDQNISVFKREYAARSDIVSRLAGEMRQDLSSEPTFELRTDGEQESVGLINSDALIRDLLLTRQQMQDKATQSNVYTALYKLLRHRLFGDGNLTRADGRTPVRIDTASGRAIDIIQKQKQTQDAINRFKALPDPGKLNAIAVETIKRSIYELGSIWEVVVPASPVEEKPSGYVECDKEEGMGRGTDRRRKNHATSGIGAPAICGEPDPNGLLKNSSWPLKFYNTCVKNQGKRGTCSAFATVAAVESRIAVERGRWVNLSEQDLYKHQRYDWFAMPPYYDDGYSPLISMTFQMMTNYKFPFERDWDYNPSFRRRKNDAQRVYTRSCDDYNNSNCSDTNHQARQHCWLVDRPATYVVEQSCSWIVKIPLIGEALGEWFCTPVERMVSEAEQYIACDLGGYDTNIPGTSGFHVDGPLPLFDPLDANGSVALAKMALGNKWPVVYCFTVPPSFGNDNHGFVSYSGPNEEYARDNKDNPGGKPQNGHCVLMTGYVDNANLPRGVAPGEGGGYFIIKNSWGCKRGDQGYYYLPYQWVKTWGTGMVAIPSVS